MSQNNNNNNNNEEEEENPRKRNIIYFVVGVVIMALGIPLWEAVRPAFKENPAIAWEAQAKRDSVELKNKAAQIDQLKTDIDRFEDEKDEAKRRLQAFKDSIKKVNDDEKAALLKDSLIRVAKQRSQAHQDSVWRASVLEDSKKPLAMDIDIFTKQVWSKDSLAKRMQELEDEIEDKLYMPGNKKIQLFVYEGLDIADMIRFSEASYVDLRMAHSSKREIKRKRKVAEIGDYKFRGSFPIFVQAEVTVVSPDVRNLVVFKKDPSKKYEVKKYLDGVKDDLQRNFQIEDNIGYYFSRYAKMPVYTMVYIKDSKGVEVYYLKEPGDEPTHADVITFLEDATNVNKPDTYTIEVLVIDRADKVLHTEQLTFTVN